MQQKGKRYLLVIGIVSFVGSAIFLLAILYSLLVTMDESKRTEDYLIAISIVLVTVCSVTYVLKTNFGRAEANELETIERENAILKKKIEQAALITELDKIKVR